MATLTTRVEKLEGVQAAAATPARLLFLGRYDCDDDVIGARESGPRLPNDVMRLAGESLDEFQIRVAAMVTGPHPLLVGLLYGHDTCLTDRAAVTAQ